MPNFVLLSEKYQSTGFKMDKFCSGLPKETLTENIEMRICLAIIESLKNVQKIVSGTGYLRNVHWKGFAQK